MFRFRLRRTGIAPTGVVPWLPSTDAMLLFYVCCIAGVLFTTLGMAARFVTIKRDRDRDRRGAAGGGQRCSPTRTSAPTASAARSSCSCCAATTRPSPPSAGARRSRSPWPRPSPGSAAGDRDMARDEGFAAPYERADKLPYEAKSAGRNRTRSASALKPAAPPAPGERAGA